MLKGKKRGNELLLIFIAGVAISIVCGIFIFFLNKIGAIDNDKKDNSFINVLLGVVFFFTPLLFSFFFFRNKHLILQCVFSFLIIATEILLFLSSLYMFKLENLFNLKLLIIAVGGTFFPFVYIFFRGVRNKAESE